MSQTTDKKSAPEREQRVYPNLPPPAKETAIPLPFWSKIYDFTNKNQNLLFFILLSICLAAGLLWWRHYRMEKMTLEASYQLEKTAGTENLKGMLQVYGVTPISPLIRYKLANAYLKDNNFEEARKEFEYLLEKFPAHPLNQQIKELLSQLKINEEWSKGELSRRLSELTQQRNLPLLTVKTSKGDIEIELYEDEAPNTVANFISLIQEGSYSPTAVYEINPELGVCFSRKEPLDYALPFEAPKLKHSEGVLGMLRDVEPEDHTEQFQNAPSDSSKFYIYTNDKENEGLDGKYTIFGRVVKGLPIVRMLAKDDAITSIVINFKRPHEYSPKTIKTEKKSSIPTDSKPISPTETTEPPK